jgi:serine/threonine-protein kinase HipA
VFVPAEEYPGALRTGHVEAISETGIAERLRRLRDDDADWLGDDEHWSLAGAQSKFTLRRLDSRSDWGGGSGHGWGIAHGTEPSTHIVKPGITSIPGQALIEHLSMRAAAAVGHQVARTEYLEFDGQPAIVVERFDRMERDGRLVRIHQEDFCQTFGMDPSKKYEADQGAGVQRIAERLREATTDDSVERFARAVIVNYLLGAPDAHAKNYSLLLVGSAARLSPLYDVASGLTAQRAGVLRYAKGAMSIGGERAFGHVLGSDWDTFAARLGLPQEQVRTWVKATATDLPDALGTELALLPQHARGVPHLDTLVPRVRRLADLTLTGLDASPPRRRSTIGSRMLAEVGADSGS